MSLNTITAGRRAARSAAPAHGLVDKETSHARITRQGTNEYLKRDVYRSLDRQRRVRKMRRVVVRAAEATRRSFDGSGSRYDAIMVTGTYRPGVSWSPKHISVLLQRMRDWCDRRGLALRYQWVMELTRAGVPHYHVLLWVPHGTRLPRPDNSGWWAHGSTRIELAKRAVGYLVKYTSKGLEDSSSGQIPKGARLFGVGSTQAERHEIRRSRLPAWLEEATEPHQLPRRVARVGWVCPDTEQVYRSPFEFFLHREEDGRFVVVFLTRGNEA